MRLPADSQSRSHREGRVCRRAFSLLELLVVIVIIGILATISLPAIKGLRGGNVLAAANRQLQDDLAYARQKAITERTTVYVVFVPTNFWSSIPGAGTPTSAQLFNNLVAGQMTDYALYAPRSAGDQPGRPSRHYITEWRSLPDGVFIPAWKFSGGTTAVTNFNTVVNVLDFAWTNIFYFPTERDNYRPYLPFVAFNAQGQLTSGQDEYIPLATGSVLEPPKDAAGNYPLQTADANETPARNSINNPNVLHINWLTGRARVERLVVR